MGRPKLTQKRRSMMLRVPEELYAEMVLLKPELLNHEGHMRYGALSDYYAMLVRKDLEDIKENIRNAASIASAGQG